MSTTVAHEDVIWHDVECGGYAADLPLWEKLAGRRGGGPGVLDLGCGTGRVALHLARRGQRVTGVDRAPELLSALGERARREGLEVAVWRADVRALPADGCGGGAGFGLAIAPMQLVQLLDAPGRASMLAATARLLAPGGQAAFALTRGTPAEWRPSSDAPPPPPDVREIDGWVYSSLPIGIEADGEAIVLRRLRQVVSPDGELRDREHSVRLAELPPGGLEDEARDAGLSPRARHEIPATDDHVGSTVVVLERRR